MRDPEAHSVKKGADWHFGYQAHVGVDKDTGIVHTVVVAPAEVPIPKDAIPRLAKANSPTEYAVHAGGSDSGDRIFLSV